MRAVASAPWFREERLAAVIVSEIRRVSEKGCGVIHFSVQDNHLHLIVEAVDGAALAAGMQRLASRVAMRLNALTGRRGRLWRERYHRRDLASPRQFRNALVYVTFNHRKHASGAERRRRIRVLDGWSSAVWILDWAEAEIVDKVREARARAGPPPIVTPRTWLASRGWKRHGLLRPTEAPTLPG